MKLTVLHVAAGVGVAAAAGLVYAASRTTGPVEFTQFTEMREGPVMEHLAQPGDLLGTPVFARHHYPQRVAPAITNIISKGFSVHYCIPDPQAAALPSEAVW
jgi:hypothetical protein